MTKAAGITTLLGACVALLMLDVSPQTDASPSPATSHSYAPASSPITTCRCGESCPCKSPLPGTVAAPVSVIPAGAASNIMGESTALAEALDGSTESRLDVSRQSPANQSPAPAAQPASAPALQRAETYTAAPQGPRAYAATYTCGPAGCGVSYSRQTRRGLFGRLLGRR